MRNSTTMLPKKTTSLAYIHSNIVKKVDI